MFVLGIVQHIWLNYHLRSWDGVFSPVISEGRNSRFRFVKYHNIFRTHQNTEGFQSFFNMFFSSQKKLCVTSKVVIATNMAESSLTVPNVGAVVDFGMHRVNEYDDEERTFVCYGCFLFKNWRS